MSCLIAPSRGASNDSFDRFLFTDLIPRPVERKRRRGHSNLFESPPVTRERIALEISIRPEEDNERWDGLS